MAEAIDYKKIQGWGADLDPANRPAVPMERTPPEGTGAHWDVPETQPKKIKVYHSVERPSLTHVFGTSTPPTGLSGRMRDVAYRLGEGKKNRWLLLLLADRVNVVEGLFDDLRRGIVPNIFKEMGLKSELQHNKKALIKRAVIGGAALGIGGLYLLFRGDERDED